MPESIDASVLVLAPVGRDGQAAAEILSGIGIAATVCPDYDDLIDRLGQEALALVVTEEGLFGNDLARLTGWIDRQPSWSDFPVIILTGAQSRNAVVAWRGELVDSLGNTTLLERPVQKITLVSAVQAAVRARRRQYDLQKLLGELETGNERFRLIVEHATDYAIMLSDADDRITAWLPGAAAVFGWSEPEMLGKPVSSIFTPEDRAEGVPEQELARACREGEAPNIRWHSTRNGERVFLDGKTVALRDRDRSLRGFLKIGKDVTERQRNEERQAVLLAELQHRVRNILAVVAALVRRSDNGSDVHDYRASLSGRITALARTQTLLTREAGAGVDLEETVRDELVAQSADESRVTILGPKVSLSPKAAEVVTLAIHELATNATKYGAIRAPAGTISVHWRCEERQGQEWLRFEWREAFVEPQLPRSTRSGFGTELITRRVPYELKGTGELEMTEDGIHCRIAFPLNPGESILQTRIPTLSQTDAD